MDIPNRSVTIHQDYSTSGIISSRNVNMLGRSANDLETRGRNRLDRNPVGGNIFYDEDPMYSFKLYDAEDYDGETSTPAKIKVYWGTWTRIAKYTYARKTLETDDGDGKLYKTIELSNNKMNWIVVVLSPPDSISRGASVDDDAQYLEPGNKPYKLVANVSTETPVNIGEPQRSGYGPVGIDGDLSKIVGMVYVDSDGHITWINQILKEDIMDVRSYYEGPFKLEAAGYGNTSSIENTSPIYNTNVASTGNSANQFYPYGYPKANAIVINQGEYQHSGSLHSAVWEYSNGFSVVDLGSSSFSNNSISVSLTFNIRAPGESSDVTPIAINAADAQPKYSQDSIFYSQLLGIVKTNSTGNIVDIMQMTHDDINIAKYSGNFAGYYGNSSSVTIMPGWIHGPYNSVLVDKETVVLPTPVIPGTFPSGEPYDLLVYLKHEVYTWNGKIKDNPPPSYEVAVEFRTTDGNHWCDFKQEFGIQKTPIGIARFTGNSISSFISDWIQQQYQPVYSDYFCTCPFSCESESISSSSSSGGSSSTIKHYVGMLKACTPAVCDKYSESSESCPTM